jgi:hypothetical protein
MPYASPQPYDNSANVMVNLVNDAVSTGLATSQAFARDAVAEATAFLNQLQVLAAQIVSIGDISVNIGDPGVVVTPYATPSDPEEPLGIEFVSPPSPPDFDGTAVLPLTVDTPPAFTGTRPTILMPAVPAALAGAAPTAPALSAVVLPTAPTQQLPNVPTMRAINLPAEPLLTLPIFTDVAPSAPAAATNVFGFSETRYTSSLIDAIRTNLLAWVDGANTGLSPAVEAALWERGRQRETAATNRKIGDVTKRASRSGLTRPPGAMYIDIGQALQEQQSTLVALSREVMIEQAKLEQSNRRFAFEQAWKVEEGMIQYSGQIAGRALDAAKFTQQVALDIYRDTVARFGHEVQAFSAKVDAFKAALQAELTKLDIYKATLEGQRLIGTLNEQDVNIYRERVAAARSVIEMFSAEVAAANTQAMVNKTQIEAFAALVGAYEATVRAKTAEFQGYATQVQAQQIKVDLYKGEAETHRALVEGYRAGVEAKVSAKSSEIEVSQKVPLERHKIGAEVFRTRNEAEASRIGALTKTFEVRTQLYDAKSRGEGTRATSEVSHFKADADLAIARANTNVEVLKANLQKLLQQVTLLIEAAKAGAQVTAQMAASALSGVNLSANMSAQGSASTSYGASNSTNLQAASTEAFNTSNSTQTSTSTSTQNLTTYEEKHNYEHSG